ncbi:MAG: carbohydrate kinase family protein, partial [bacterium]
QKSKILFLDHYFTEAGLAAANWIKANGGMVVVDAERPVPEFEPILTLADYIIAARKYAEAETGVSDPQKAAQILQEEFGNVVVVTAGENGSFCQTPEQSLYQAAYSVNLVDTTGAGDVYHGAFMVGLLENWPLQKILEFSSAVAAMKCRGLGGRASIPTRKEVIEFLKQKGTQKYLP